MGTVVRLGALFLAVAAAGCTPEAASIPDSDAGPAELDWDGGPGPCALLVATRCEDVAAGADCWDHPACLAAQLTAEHEPASCAARLEDGQRYPRCTSAGHLASPCARLKDRCCGPQGECDESAGCLNAGAVAGSDADEACTQAMDDDTAFPPCNPSRG